MMKTYFHGFIKKNIKKKISNNFFFLIYENYLKKMH